MELWRQRSVVAFVRALVLCCFSSFLFGWHVHEKAVLMIIIPMTLLVLYSKEDARIFLIFSVTGFYSLFPLLFSPFENILKVLLLVISSIFTFIYIEMIYNPESSLSLLRIPLLNLMETLYVLGLIPLGLFNSLGFWLFGMEQRLPFLPLLLTSLYCSIGVMYCWIQFYYLFLFGKTLSFKNVIGQSENISRPKTKSKAS